VSPVGGVDSRVFVGTVRVAEPEGTELARHDGGDGAALVFGERLVDVGGHLTAGLVGILRMVHCGIESGDATGGQD